MEGSTYTGTGSSQRVMLSCSRWIAPSTGTEIPTFTDWLYVIRSAAVSGLSIRPDTSPVGTGVGGVPVEGVGAVGPAPVPELPPHAPAITTAASAASRSVRTEPSLEYVGPADQKSFRVLPLSSGSSPAADPV